MLYSRKIMLASFCGECAGFLWTYKNSPRIEKRVSCAQSWLGGICIEILQPVPSQEYLHRPAYSPPIAPSEKSDVEIANQRRTSAQLAGAGEWPASSRPWWVRPRTPPFLVRCTLGGIIFIEKSRFMSSSFVVEFFLFGSFSSSNEAIKTIVGAKKSWSWLAPVYVDQNISNYWRSAKLLSLTWKIGIFSPESPHRLQSYILSLNFGWTFNHLDMGLQSSFRSSEAQLHIGESWGWTVACCLGMLVSFFLASLQCRVDEFEIILRLF